MHQTRAIITDSGFQRMAEGVAEVQQRAVALFGFVARNE